LVDANYDDSLEAISSHHDPMASLIDAEIQTAILEAISCDPHKWGQRPLTVGTTLFSAHSLLRI
jgi:glutamate/tyrosine decarboxylase-like PLP-dependent enzyme